LLERPVYREFFAAGLTVLDPVEKLKTAPEPVSRHLLARLEVEKLVQEVGLIGDNAGLEIKSLATSNWTWQKPTVNRKESVLERKKSVVQ
jgi:ATPase MipZ